MKRIGFLLGFLSILLLIGCSAKTSEDNDSTNTGMANPWTSIQKDVIEQTLDTIINIPEEAEDVSCTTLTTEKLYQVNFDYLDISFVYRLKKTKELEDISGTYFEWGEPNDDLVNGNPARVYYCEENENVHELALWYDEGISHSLFATADHELDGFDLIAVAINLVTAKEIAGDDWIEDPNNYVKNATQEDVEYDEESDMQYVKNQLIVCCDKNTPKEKGKEIAEEFDAEVVGYIEVISQFQIEFNSDKTYAELEKLAEEIESKYDYVDMCIPNYVDEFSY